MINLLLSNLMRLKNNLVFWTCVVVMFLAGLIFPMSMYFDKLKFGNLDTACAENVAFGYNLIACILCAAFCCIFQGDEYADGTVNNKIIASHSRTNIYVSQVFVSAFAGMIMCIVYIVPSLIIGAVFLGGFQELNGNEIAGYYIIGFLVMAVCVALYSFVSVTVQKKLGGTALCFLMICLIIYVSILTYQTLHLPENTAMYVDGEMIYGLNPRYPNQQEREVLQLFFDISPAGQAYQLCYRKAEHIALMAVSDIVLFIALLLAGVFTFNKKDLK